MVYGRRVDGKELTLGVSGKLYRNGMVMFDRQTDSLWLHLTGKAIKGKMAGKSLPIITTAGMVRWKQWLNKHPKTRVLSVQGVEDLPDTYARYHASDETGIRPRRHRDARLSPKAMVMGVRIGKAQKAYPHSVMEKRRMIVDRVGDKEVLLYYEPDTGTTVGFEAIVEDQRLAFETKQPEPGSRTRPHRARGT